MFGAIPRRRDSQSLWELDWLHVPSASTTSNDPCVLSASTTAPFQQWHHRLGHLRGSRLLSLVCRDLLGHVSRDATLQCQGCRLGKLSYLILLASSLCDLDSVPLDYFCMEKYMSANTGSIHPHSTADLDIFSIHSCERKLSMKKKNSA
jgi:hypothetical protein